MIKLGIKERIERNVTVWLLGTLLTGFLSGIAVYRTIEEIARLSVVPTAALEDSKRRIAELERKVAESEARADNAAMRMRQAYQQIQTTRVRVIHAQLDLEAATEIKKRLFDLGAQVTLKLMDE